MATGSAEYYKLKLEKLRNALMKDMVEERALRIQKELDQVKHSTRGLEGRITSMDEVMWNLKNELTRVQAERDAKETELIRLRRQNRQLMWKNFELETESDSLRNSLRLYRSTTEGILACRRNRSLQTP